MIITLAIKLLWASQLSAFPKNFSLSAQQRDWDPRIPNDQDAKDGQFPYQLSLQCDGFHFCGASLIEVDGRQFALTAAHCVVQLRCEDVTVVGGDLSLSDHTGLEQYNIVESVIIHEEYDAHLLSNDIALIQMRGDFSFNNHVQPISLPEEGEETFGNITVSGWGALYAPRSPYPDILQTADLPVITNKECSRLWGRPFGNGVLCAGLGDGTQGFVCFGDSGSPATTRRNSLNYEYDTLAGVTSFADRECGNSGVPAGFTRVSHYISWINQHARNITDKKVVP